MFTSIFFLSIQTIFPKYPARKRETANHLLSDQDVKFLQ
jgi:hypothetical protein